MILVELADGSGGSLVLEEVPGNQLGSSPTWSWTQGVTTVRGRVSLDRRLPQLVAPADADADAFEGLEIEAARGFASDWIRAGEQQASSSSPPGDTSTVETGAAGLAGDDFLPRGSPDHDFKFGFEYRAASVESVTFWPGGCDAPPDLGPAEGQTLPVAQPAPPWYRRPIAVGAAIAIAAGAVITAVIVASLGGDERTSVTELPGAEQQEDLVVPESSDTTRTEDEQAATTAQPPPPETVEEPGADEPPPEPPETAVEISSEDTYRLQMSDGQQFPIYRFEIGDVDQLAIVLPPPGDCWVIQYAPNDVDLVGSCSTGFIGGTPGQAPPLLTGTERTAFALRSDTQLVVGDGLLSTQGFEPDLAGQQFVTVMVDGGVTIDGEEFVP